MLGTGGSRLALVAAAMLLAQSAGIHVQGPGSAMAPGAPQTVAVKGMSARTADPVLARVPLAPNAGGMALDARNGHLFVASTGPLTSTAYILSTGGQPQRPPPAGPGVVAMIDAASGKVLATTRVGLSPRRVLVAPGIRRVFVFNDGSPVGHGPSLSVLDAASGALVRTVPLQAVPADSAVDDRTDLLFSAYPASRPTVRGAVEVRDALTGTAVISTTVGYNPESVAVEAQTGRVFVGNNGFVYGSGDRDSGACTLDLCDPTVSILDARTGRSLGTVVLHHGVGGGSVVQNCGPYLYPSGGRVLAVVGDGQLGGGSLSFLDPATGALRASLPFDTNSCALGIDSRSGHALNPNAGGGTPDSTAQGTYGAALFNLGTGIPSRFAGAPTRYVATGLNPDLVAVDSRNGRAFLTDAGGDGGGDMRVLNMADGATYRSLLRGLRVVALTVDELRQRVFAIAEPVPPFPQLPATATLLVLDANVGLPPGSVAEARAPVLAVADAARQQVFVAGDPAAAFGYATAVPGATVDALDSRSGRLRHAMPVGARPAGMVIDPRSGHLFVVSAGDLDHPLHPVASPDLRMLDATTGSLRATIPLTGTVGPPLLDAATGRVFVVTAPYEGAQASALLSIDSGSGRLAATTPLSGTVGLGAIDEHAGVVYLVRSSGCNPPCSPGIIAVSARTGAVLRTLPLADQIGALAVDPASGRLFLLDELANAVIGLDPLTGQRLGSTPFEGRVEYTLTADSAERQLFVPANLTLNSQDRVLPVQPLLQGVVYALSGADGGVLRAIRVQGGLIAGSLAVDSLHHRLFVGSQPATGNDDIVSMIDTVSGTVLAQAPVGLYPASVAIDPRTERVFVACEQTNSVSVLDERTGAPVGY